MTLNELLTDPEIIDALQELVSERRKRKAGKLPDVGSPADVNGNANRGPMSVERMTAGGLMEPTEDDRQADLTAEAYATKGGLFTPDRVPTVPEKLRSLFFAEKPKPPYNLTADQRAYRETSGGMLTPEP